ncbi:MAG: glycosyltransferase family 39 protein, partial [Calditrichaeota bacterium]|nr:glycosyltransferase family 39 protein [Calditrichota bacterium]
IIFHQVLSRFLSPSGAALLTFFLVFTPEMFAHASLSLTNLPGAAFVCGGSLFLYLWWKEEKSSHLIISGLMFGLNVWTRSDGIVFSVAAVFIMFLITIRKKMYLPLIFHGLLSVLPFIVWQVYLKIVIHAASIERFRTYLFWDEERFSYMVKTIYLLVTSTNLYGLSFYIFAIALIANIRYLKSNWPLLATILFSFLLYTFMFYQIDPETQDSIQTMMTASYKRGLFYFIPMILFYSGITPLSRKLFAVLDREYNRFVYGESSPS